MKPFIQKIKEYTNLVVGPVRKTLKPVSDKLDVYLQPIKKSWRKYADKNPRESRIFKWLFIAITGGISFLFLLIFLVMIGAFGHMPGKKELRNIETANASEIYSSDGVLLGKYFTENRTTIELDSISPYLITALLAIEDKRFFEHSGIDLRSWLRVFKGLATNAQGLGGGSTLSQQLSKNLYGRKNYRIPGVSLLINKIRENITSIRLEKIYNKEELLTLYLNTVPFGGNRFGIQEAARYFYNKRPAQLTADEAATMIGMLKATTALDPTRNPKNSKARRDLVLSQMLKNKDFRFESKEMATISKMINTGAINEEEYQSLIEKPISAKPHEEFGNNDGPATYFREFLRTRELPDILKNIQKEDGKSYNIYTDGLKIYTSLDSRMQEHAEYAVRKHMSYLQNEFRKHWQGVKDEKPWGDDKWIDDQVKRSDRYKSMEQVGLAKADIDSVFNIPVPMKIFTWTDKASEVDTTLSPLDSVRYYFTMLNTGFMAMDHSNGEVKAWVGGIDFLYFKYDHILSSRQVGSTFKPIVYAAALVDSIKPCDFFQNSTITIEDWTPDNSDHQYGGYYSMTGGLAKSVNVIAARMIEKTGIQKTIDMARKLGISAPMPREYGISLGAVEVPLYEMMSAFATMANEGYATKPVSVLKIEDRYGNVIYDYESMTKKQAVQVIDSTTSYKMTRMMQNVIIYGTANPLRSQYCRHCDFAGKTGTSQNHSDGWFIGYNPKIVTGAWVGGPSPAVRFRNMLYGSGTAMALPIVGHFWYQVSIDPKLSEVTKLTFRRDEKINREMVCPLYLGFALDKYYAVMQDSMLKDSMMRSGFRELSQVVNTLFPVDSLGNPIIEDEESESEEGKGSFFKRIFSKKDNSDDEESQETSSPDAKSNDKNKPAKDTKAGDKTNKEDSGKDAKKNNPSSKDSKNKDN